MEFSKNIQQAVKKVVEEYGEGKFIDVYVEAVAHYFNNPLSEELVVGEEEIRIKTEHLPNYNESLGEVWLALARPHKSVRAIGGIEGDSEFIDMRDYIVSLHPDNNKE